MESFLKLIEHFNPSIISIQETHHKRKGKLRLTNYTVFESIRNKKGGGTLLAIKNELSPKLINDYSEDTELVVVQIKTNKADLRIISGHGPQENWIEEKRAPFFEQIETEIEKSRNAGVDPIIQIDSNSKLGSKYIKGDPHNMSQNGKLLSE